ncbi:DivIVA domain-containing protein [Christensenellaceae bacterium OttesenSCG-928-L17]|nr:DivIVA domain-containing protein [Christensenellaceae bacterium OttesenSCG-928-L17]
MRADDIVCQRFTKVFRGYDVQEVDLFLDEVIRSMDTLEKERNQLLARVEALLYELSQCDRTIALLKEKARAEAQGEEDAVENDPAEKINEEQEKALLVVQEELVEEEALLEKSEEQQEEPELPLAVQEEEPTPLVGAQSEMPEHAEQPSAEMDGSTT